MVLLLSEYKKFLVTSVQGRPALISAQGQLGYSVCGLAEVHLSHTDAEAGTGHLPCWLPVLTPEITVEGSGGIITPWRSSCFRALFPHGRFPG